MKKWIVYVLMFLLAEGFSAGAQVYRFNNGTVSFFSEAPVENIDAHSNALNSIINIQTNEIVFVVSMRTFQFKKSLMQEHFNEKYVESDKYPLATYKGKINETIDWTKNGTYRITSKGTLTIHGVSKVRSDTAEVIISDGKIVISGTFPVKVADHEITIPKILFYNIAEVVSVKFYGSFITTAAESSKSRLKLSE